MDLVAVIATRVPAGRAAIRYRGSPLPVLGPLSLLPTPPASCFQIILPASAERANIVIVSPVRRHRSRKCRPRSRLLHFHRSVFACALVGPFGEGIGSLHLRLQSFISASLRITSSVCASVHPCPRNGAAGNERPTKNLIGTLPPDPLPPSYVGEGAGCMLAKVFCLIRRRHPPRRVPPRSGSRLFTAYLLLLQREAATAPDASDTVAAGVACVRYRQHHRQPIR